MGNLRPGPRDVVISHHGPAVRNGCKIYHHHHHHHALNNMCRSDVSVTFSKCNQKCTKRDMTRQSIAIHKTLLHFAILITNTQQVNSINRVTELHYCKSEYLRGHCLEDLEWPNPLHPVHLLGARRGCPNCASTTSNRLRSRVVLVLETAFTCLDSIRWRGSRRSWGGSFPNSRQCGWK